MFKSLLGVFAMTCAAQATTTINGAGATFPYPLYSKWFSEFRKVDADTQVNYNSIGSGGGTVMVASQVGKGTEFICRFPA